MATPVQTLYRLVWGGRLFDKESWSCSLHIGSALGINLAANNFAAPLTAWMGRATSLISVAAKLDFVKFNQINPVTGRYVLQTSEELLQNDLGTGASGAAPAQLTIAVSTRTALSRGRGHAGRFYPPTTAPNVEPLTGLISIAQAQGAATSAATLLTAINTIVGVGNRCVVFSKIGQQAEPITRVQVGRVIDTMRSRRASMVEDYSSAIV